MVVNKTGLNVGVIGFGVVGSVTAAKLYSLGNEVYVNDIRPPKDLEGWDANFHFRKHYRLGGTDATFFVLPTPSTEEVLYRGLSPDERLHVVEGRFNETLDTRLFTPVIESAGRQLKHHDRYHLFVVRSTVEPGTTRRFGKTLEQISGKKMGKDFGMGMIPEFLRAYNNVQDEETAKMIVLGHGDKRSLNLMKRIYKNDAESRPGEDKGKSRLYYMSLEEAELVKLENNAINAIWISLHNAREEFYELLTEKGMPVDYDRMTRVLTTMTESFTSAVYGTSAGLWFGGTCLKKDPQALHTWAEDGSRDRRGFQSHFTQILAQAIHVNDHLQRQILVHHRIPKTLRDGLPERLAKRDHRSYENVRKFLRAFDEINGSLSKAKQTKSRRKG